MRPLVLRMSAFGPYAGNVSIPLQNLGKSGLYLITGDTGAGKTTIFDAICYALFGEASGNSREASMFRSKYAKDDTPTEVELWFEHNNKQYKVLRNPEYLRPTKRGDGFTKQIAEATLTMPDGRIITKIKDVNTSIEEVLGINRNQFSQIAMLAQGDFLKLLHADTRQRQEIFRELFCTGNYSNLQYALEERRKEIYAKVAEGRKSIDQYISGISVEEDSRYIFEVTEAQNGLLTVEDTLELLDKLIRADSDRRLEEEAKLKDIQNKLEEVNADIGAAKALVVAKTNLEQSETKLARKLPLETELKEAFEKSKEALKNKDTYISNAKVLENEFPKYEKSFQLLKEIDNTIRLKEDCVKALNKMTVVSEERRSSLEKDKEELTSYGEAGSNLERLANALGENIKLEKEFLDFKAEIRQYNLDREALISSRRKYKEDDEHFNELKNIYESLDQAFRDGQAGILAEKLTEGMPCPVCGSTTHPHKAVRAAEVPTEAELKRSRANMEEARAKANASSEQTGRLRAIVETREEDLKKKAAKYMEIKELSDISSLMSVLDNKYKENQDLRSELKQTMDSEKHKVERKKELEEIIPALEKEIRDIEADILKQREALSGYEAKIAENIRQSQEIKKDLQYESREEASKVYNELIGVANLLQEDFDRTNARYLDNQNEIVTIKSQIESYKRTLSGTENVDIEEMNTIKSKFADEQSLIMNRIKKISSGIDINSSIRNNIEKQSALIADIENKLSWVASLADTANGKLKGKEKLMLETYIQTTYFDRIIRRANIRLMTMSGGQYELVRKTESAGSRGQIGLDLWVIDHYVGNNSERSVKSLSGGESFMASLSLALGLSDEVQSSSGGIRIDTMFVDEGFGTLDTDTLSKAYQALSCITEGDKLVGIISHVSELKEKIDRQIVVTKLPYGGSSVSIDSPIEIVGE